MMRKNNKENNFQKINQHKPNLNSPKMFICTSEASFKSVAIGIHVKASSVYTKPQV